MTFDEFCDRPEIERLSDDIKKPLYDALADYYDVDNDDVLDEHPFIGVYYSETDVADAVCDDFIEMSYDCGSLREEDQIVDLLVFCIDKTVLAEQLVRYHDIYKCIEFSSEKSINPMYAIFRK